MTIGRQRELFARPKSLNFFLQFVNLDHLFRIQFQITTALDVHRLFQQSGMLTYKFLKWVCFKEVEHNDITVNFS
jgi:hypothetical protein